ncbi:hypothetical protein WPS_28540 [Vulcanimicrobium alpinum]|uniref:YCII-related domain-containing protein n=2 Tax=Vulcanimicrobium alpinum TaxID=3016050 RepID=A0AAN1XY85_UNVUL|nr:hypothetical protein WPS_28540 [Vulcanimicrobium alpinum]
MLRECDGEARRREEPTPYFVVIRERSARWDWSLPMHRQVEWDAHAAFMDTLEADGFLLAGGPLGEEDRAARVLHVVNAPDRDAVERRLADDPWEPLGLLRTESIEPWTVLLGGFRADARLWRPIRASRSVR